jgi:hypothetical protein
VIKLRGTRKDSFWLFSLSDQPFKDQPGRDRVEQARKLRFMTHAWLWMILRKKESLNTGRFAHQLPFGLDLYAGRNFEQPFISHLGKIKIKDRDIGIKPYHDKSVHKESTTIINNLLIF